MMELVSALNSRIMGRIFELVVPVELRDRVCLLVMGSEARREQLLKTDQDNALVLADDLDWPGLPEAMDRFSAALAQVGRSEQHPYELQPLMRNSYAVFCLKKKKRPAN